MPTSRDSFHLVVSFLGAALLLCVIGVTVLAFQSLPIPGLLENVAIASLAAIAGLLARSPTQGATDVRVVNPPQRPVPVEE